MCVTCQLLPHRAWEKRLDRCARIDRSFGGGHRSLCAQRIGQHRSCDRPRPSRRSWKSCWYVDSPVCRLFRTSFLPSWSRFGDNSRRRTVLSITNNSVARRHRRRKIDLNPATRIPTRLLRGVLSQASTLHRPLRESLVFRVSEPAWVPSRRVLPTRSNLSTRRSAGRNADT